MRLAGQVGGDPAESLDTHGRWEIVGLKRLSDRASRGVERFPPRRGERGSVQRALPASPWPMANQLQS